MPWGCEKAQARSRLSAAGKLLYMVHTQITKKRWAPIANWAKILNQLAFLFEGRLPLSMRVSHLHTRLDTLQDGWEERPSRRPGKIVITRGLEQLINSFHPSATASPYPQTWDSTSRHRRPRPRLHGH